MYVWIYTQYLFQVIHGRKIQGITPTSNIALETTRVEWSEVEFRVWVSVAIYV